MTRLRRMPKRQRDTDSNWRILLTEEGQKRRHQINAANWVHHWAVLCVCCACSLLLVMSICHHHPLRVFILNHSLPPPIHLRFSLNSLPFFSLLTFLPKFDQQMARRPLKSVAFPPPSFIHPFLFLSLLVQFLSAFDSVQQQLHFLEHNDGFDAVDKQSPLPVIQFVQSPVNSLTASHQLLFDRLSEAKSRFAHRQQMEDEEGGGRGDDERRIPRPQRRWLMRTTALKNASGGDQFVKRVVSESELNSLLKNAWLGKKRR